MIKYQNNVQANHEDWTKYYKEDTCLKVGINPKLPMTICGYESEPQHGWNDRSHKYNGPINGYGYWVNQLVKDSQGRLWKQNPVMVIVDGTRPKTFKFGEKVLFDKLGAYYSKRKYGYQFRAKEIRHE